MESFMQSLAQKDEAEIQEIVQSHFHIPSRFEKFSYKCGLEIVWLSCK